MMLKMKKYIPVFVVAALIFGHSTVWAQANPKQINSHYELVISKNNALCKPLTKLYNELLVKEEKEYKEKSMGITHFEAYQPEEFAKIGLVEPPTKEIELPLPPHGFHATYKRKVSLVDFFDEGKPRIVKYVHLLGGGGKTETTQIIVLKKNTEYNASINDPNLIDWDLPLIKERTTTSRIFMSSGRPYIIVNRYTFLPVSEESKVMVYKLTPSGLKNVCYISLGNKKN